jgi:hypothetical protein
MSLLNLARMSTATIGTGTITLGSAVTGFLSFAAAGAVDGGTYRYAIRDGAASEYGYGVYTSSGTTFTRNVMKSTNSDNAISLSGTAEIFITAGAEDHIGQGALSPAQITADQNNYSPTSLAKSNTILLDADAAHSITGIATGWLGRVIVLIGDDTYPITLVSASGSSSAANRFNIPYDFVLRPKAACMLRHSGTNWDMIGGNRDLETIGIALSDETTALTTGTNKATMSLPYAFYVVSVYASVNTVSSSGIPTVDINEAGTTIMATNKLTIDASEKTSATAATAAGVTDPDIAANAEIGFDIDVAGTGAKGLKVFLVGFRK